MDGSTRGNLCDWNMLTEDGKLTFGRDVEDIWKDHFDYFYREYGKLFRLLVILLKQIH